MKKLSNKKIVFFKFMVVSIILTWLLTSCWKKEEKIVVTSNMTSTASTNSWVASVKNNSGTINSNPEEDKFIKNIEKIEKWEDLEKINPWIKNDPNNKHPKFVELQKKQIVLWVKMYKNKWYSDIQKKISEIYEWNEIKSKELKEIDEKINDLIKRQSNWEQSEKFNDEWGKIQNSKSKLMQKFTLSKEYKDYINKNQEKINSLNEEAKKYLTPEIISLQKEVSELQKEVYSATSK